MKIKILSWNCNGKLKKSLEFLKSYSQYHVIHLSETKHNSSTNFNIPKNFTPVSKPGVRLGDVDRGGNIVFIQKFLYKRIRKTRYFEWGIIIYFNETVLVFVYFVPSDSRYYRDESFTEFFTALSGISKSGKTVFIVGDHNARFGKLEFANRTHNNNVDIVKNTQGTLLAAVYNKCNFYPLNHFCSDDSEFIGNFTFFRGEKKSQVDFLFTNDHTDVSQFSLDEVGLQLSDHVMITFTVSMKLELPSNALLRWSRDTNTVGKQVMKRLFRVNFDVDETQMQGMLTEKLASFENRLSSGEIRTEEIVCDFNELLETTFKQCKTAKHQHIAHNDSWHTLHGKELWERIDWSGKMSSTKAQRHPIRKICTDISKIYTLHQWRNWMKNQRRTFTSRLPMMKSQKLK